MVSEDIGNLFVEMEKRQESSFSYLLDLYQVNIMPKPRRQGVAAGLRH